MEKYIDADALREKIQLRANEESEKNHSTYSSGYWAGLTYARWLLDDMPAADVEQVRHGEWRGGRCSVCGAQIATDAAFDYLDGSDQNFCYSCGAKMDGGSEE